MKSKFKVGLVTSLSGRWPRELPEKRKEEYGKFFREKFSFCETVEPEFVVSNGVELEKVTTLLKREEVEAVVLLYGAFSGDDYATYLGEKLKVPVILWAPYEPPFTGDRLYANALVALTMNSASLKRLGLETDYVYGSLDDVEAMGKLEKILKVLAVKDALANTTLGLLGYRPTAFYNSSFNEGLIRRTFGVKMEETDLKIVFDKMAKVPEETVERDMAEISQKFPTNLPEGHLENHSRLYFALKEIVKEQGYDYSVLKCWPEMGSLKTTPCAVLGRLADEDQFIGCEGDVDAMLAYIAQNQLTDTPCFVTDLINIDKVENTLTFWHCGNAGEKLLDKNSKPELRNHPLAGQGTAIWGTLKQGKVTVSRFCDIDGEYVLFVLKGEAVPTTRNTRGVMVNVKIAGTKVEKAIDTIITNAVPHHYSIVWEDVFDEMVALAKSLNIKVISVE